MGFHYGPDCLQACLYSHDRNQELVKWRRHQHKIELKLLEKAEITDKAGVIENENKVAV